VPYRSWIISARRWCWWRRRTLEWSALARWPEELRLKSHLTEHYGKSFIPANMTIQDFGVSYAESNPILIIRTRLRHVGKAGTSMANS